MTNATKTQPIPVKAIEMLFPTPYYENSLCKSIPIEMLELVRASYKAAGMTIRVKFRGPRAVQSGIIRGGHYRTKVNARQTCLKEFATHFSVYI